MRDIVTNHPYLSQAPLNPRDAFFGGRTSVIKNYHKIADDEKVLYYDVCSLYPYINKIFKVPMGHPKIYVGNETATINLATFEGILKITVLPPANLYHPVLPYKMHNKLLFFLCYTCALNHSENCDHTESERSFTGTWVADEIRLALQKGYRVLNIYEGWEYTVQVGVFAGYVDTFLKEKQEASGYPHWCTDDVKKQQYIREYKEKEGIDLDPAKIAKNPAKRSCTKLCLNSFWGKFGENPVRRSQMKIITDSKSFFDLIMNSSLEVSNVIVINNETLLISYDSTEEARENLKTVNVAVAAYTTCGARLKLYQYLEKLERRVLYLDTDSVIFTQKPNEPTLPLGDFLGDLTDELAEYGEGSFITEFVSGGPKNYAFEVFSPQTKSKHYLVKAKGFTLNYANSQIINFNSLKDIVLHSVNSDYNENDELEFLVTNSSKIVRKGMGNLYSTNEQKIMKLQYSKRKQIDHFYSLPWGHI